MSAPVAATVWRTSRYAIDMTRPRVMGIVNVTPDSFSDGRADITPARAIALCERLLADGADLLDIGGESSRPGALPVSADVEIARVRPVLEAAVALGCPISIDTTKPEVMRVALDLGADIVNDIAALRTPGALEVVAAHPGCGVCLMHMRGRPTTMQHDTAYLDVVAEVRAFLGERIEATQAAGVARDRIVVDPGVGFGKTPAQNLEMLARQRELLALGVPLLAGWSRKSTLARLAGLGPTPPAERDDAQRARLDAASAVAAVLAVERGASVVRVHEVAGTVAALAIWQAASGGAR